MRKKPAVVETPLNIKWIALSYALIIAVGLIIYSNTFQCSFHFDDKKFIVDNMALRNMADLQQIWNFLPCRFVLYLSFALNYHFNGLDVFGYHLVNLMIHLGSALLVWHLILLTFSTPALKENDKTNTHAWLLALLAALVFVAHPLQTEAVTYIAQRAASLVTFFYLAALNLYVQSRLIDEKKAASSLGRFYYAASLIMTVAAMFTKEIAITLPLMMALYEFSFFKLKKSFAWGRLIPFLLMLLIIPLTMALTKSGNAISNQEMNTALQGSSSISSGHYLLTQLRVMVTYMRLVFLPINQNIDYDYPISHSLFELSTLLSFFALLFVLWGAKQLFAQYRLMSFGVFWFFLSLLPESSIFPIDDVIFEHRLYLPLVGFSIFLVSGLYYWLCKQNIKVTVIVVVALVIFFSILTYQRNKVWQDEITLWKDALQKSPHKARPYNNLGELYRDQNKLDQAMYYYHKTIELGGNAKTYSNLGVIYAHQGQYEQAMANYEKAIALDPGFKIAYTNEAMALDQLGIAAGSKGDFPSAIQDFSKAIKYDPDDAQAYNNRGYAYGRENNYDQALLDLNKAIALKPVLGFYINRMLIYYDQKDYDKAWGDLHQAQELGGQINARFLALLKQASGRDH